MKKVSLLFACVAMITATAFAGNVTNKKTVKKEIPKTHHQAAVAGNSVKQEINKETQKKGIAPKKVSKTNKAKNGAKASHKQIQPKN